MPSITDSANRYSPGPTPTRTEMSAGVDVLTTLPFIVVSTREIWLCWPDSTC